MPEPIPLGDKLLRLPAGWYWYTVGRDDGGFAQEQLDNLIAMGAIRVVKTAPGLWSVDKPGTWRLLEVLRETQWQVLPYTWGPADAPKGEATTPQDVGQEWEPPKGLPDAIKEGAEEAAGKAGDIGKTILIGAGIVGGAILLSRLLR